MARLARLLVLGRVDDIAPLLPTTSGNGAGAGEGLGLGTNVVGTNTGTVFTLYSSGINDTAVVLGTFRLRLTATVESKYGSDVGEGLGIGGVEGNGFFASSSPTVGPELRK